MKKREKNNWWLTEGILVATVPVLGYLITYLYESNYNSTLGLPLDFISIDLTSTLNAMAALSIAIGFAYTLTVISEFSTMIPTGLKMPFVRLALGVLYTFYIATIYAGTDYEIYYTLIYGLPVLGVFIVVDFIVPILSQRKTKGYLKKVALSEKQAQDGLRKVPNFLGKFISKVPGGVFTYFFVLMFVILGAVNKGTSDALGKKDFYKVNDANEVVVKILPDSVISSEVRDNKLTRDFTIHPLNNENQSLHLSKYEGPKIIVPKP